MKKVVLVLGTFEPEASREGKPLTVATREYFEELVRILGIDAEIVFAIEDQILAGRDKKTVGIKRIRDERPRVLGEISRATPDLVVCFGPIAAACVFDKGSMVEDDLTRALHYPLGEHLPVAYTLSLDNVRTFPGLRQWIELDLRAALEGHIETVWGNYRVVQPGESGLFTTDAALLGLDTETFPSFDYYASDARLRMVQLTGSVGEAITVQCTPGSGVPDWLREIIEDPSIKKVGSNIGFDYKWLRRFGAVMQNFEDTSTREHLIDSSNPRTDLKSLTFKYLPRLGDYSRAHRKLVKARKGWEHIEDHEMYQYAGADAESSLATYLGQEPLLKSLERPRQLFYELGQVLADMEFNGVVIDRAANADLDQRYRTKLSGLAGEIVPVLGPLNLDSPIQLARALKRVVPGIDLSVSATVRALSSDGAPDDDDPLTTKYEVLKREEHKHPVISKVLEYRQYRARHRTFIDKLVNGYAVEHHGGLYVHPSFHLERVETYRTSSSSPNMQNIPVKDFEHPELSVKRQFVSRFPGGQILNVDQSQVEIRFAAWASGDPRMLAAIGSGEDIHRAMAAQMLGKADPAAVTEQERHECKTRTFLILYGGGARKLAQDLKISDMRARQLINDYFAAFSGLRAYIDQVHTTVKRDLCVQTHFGFVRRFARPTKWRSIDGFSVLRRAFNTMIQNGAACLLYCALLELHSAMQSRKLQSKIILQVHDSILIDVYPGEMEVVAPLAKWAMEEASIKKAREFGVNFALPLRADIQVGPSWGSVEDYKPTVED